jgi:membrane protein
VTGIREVPAHAKLRVERARARYGAVDIVVRTFKRYSEDDGGFYAASLTYYTFFSIFPILIFAASALGYLTFLNEGFRNDLLREGLDAVPLIGDILTKETLDSLQEQRGTLAFVGLLMALYAGSGGVVALEHALNKVNRVTREPGFLHKRLRSLKWLAALLLVAPITIGVSSLAQFAGSFVQDNLFGTALLSLLLHAAGAALGTGIFLTAYLFLPATPGSWRDVLPGAIAAGIAFELLKTIGAWYLAQGQDTRAATFGAFKTAAALLVASYLLAQLTLLAAELNAVLAERRGTRQSSMSVDREIESGGSGGEETK